MVDFVVLTDLCGVEADLFVDVAGSSVEPARRTCTIKIIFGVRIGTLKVWTEIVASVVWKFVLIPRGGEFAGLHLAITHTVSAKMAVFHDLFGLG